MLLSLIFARPGDEIGIPVVRIPIYISDINVKVATTHIGHETMTHDDECCGASQGVRHIFGIIFSTL